MLFDADSKADLNTLFSWLDDGLVKGELERLAEGRFVVLLEAGVHDHYVVEDGGR